ncbi:MAG: hypothetical protein QF483_05940 [Gammaproteobacteria bacterium]|jgi:hypothetical protein|nr:hypothetical protein [Chromatiales bacterium]MCP4925739.1 hypothetical protein [Gammaproteobacteria bacterium]MDP7419402.1 hypothetical protein [Gammaproteobacteria bacterium]HJP37821.1 hypothetical protein [Gammaproteobacteria bacterium]
MRWYNNLVVRTSQSAWLFINSFVFAFGSLAFVFMNINTPFEATVGTQMFDFQNDLTVEQIFVQLTNYDESARALYHAFLFIDFYFPFFAGLVMAAAGAYAWRHLSSKHYEAIYSRNLFIVFLIPTLFDWGENIFALSVVNAWPAELGWAATGLVLCKQVKLASMVFLQAVVFLSLALALVKWLGVKTGLVK